MDDGLSDLRRNTQTTNVMWMAGVFIHSRVNLPGANEDE